jgi:hypothetical protein
MMQRCHGLGRLLRRASAEGEVQQVPIPRVNDRIKNVKKYFPFLVVIMGFFLVSRIRPLKDQPGALPYLSRFSLGEGKGIVSNQV